MRRTLMAVALLGLLGGQIATAATIHDENFDVNDGGYSVVNQGGPEGPWTYDLGSGTWLANGSENLGAPSHSRLTSPAVNVTQSGPVELSFTHRYSIESDLWDGGAVFVSVNGGGFTQVLSNAFSANPYTGFGLIGNHDLLGGQGFNGDSPGYGAGEYITSVASLGSLTAGDTVAVQFLGAWDEFAKGQTPNWQISGVTITQAVPEPASMMTLAIAALGVTGMAWRRRSRRKRVAV